jgi:hypothetical protein
VNVACWLSTLEDTVYQLFGADALKSDSLSTVGKTVPLEGYPDDDLDIETLREDLIDLLVTLFPDPQKASTFLVGHK